ncbi:MAG TPA: hypothetical protein VJY62_03520 [Bacteroidia bacterium]|nr:hypothetical protein [Bacteroidia bacterium]
MKKLLLMLVLLVPALAFGQSNESGTIQIGIGGVGIVGGASITSTYQPDTSINFPGGPSKSSAAGFKAGFGIKAQYGIAEFISAGIYIRREAVAYLVTDENFDYYGSDGGGHIDATDFALGVEAKFYVVNKDRFNLFFGPSIGFTTGTAKLRDYVLDVKGGLSGLNYGLGGGINWYWGDHVGMSFDFGYTGQSLSGEPDDLNDFDPSYGEIPVTKYKITGGNVYIGLAFIAKFGGN